MAFVAGPVARANNYVAVDVITSAIPRKFKKICHVVTDLVLVAFSAFFLLYCVPRFAFMKIRFVSTAMEIPM